MNVAEIIDAVKKSGAMIALDDDGRLKVDGWRSLSTLDRERVRAYRDEIIEHLRDGDEGNDVRPATNLLTGIDTGEDSEDSPPPESASVRRVRVSWPGASSRAEAEARMMVKALAGRSERHADVEPMYLFGMRSGECRLPVCAAHVLLRAHAEGRRLEIDELDVDERTREYEGTKAWLESLVSMLHRGELDQRTLLIRVGAIRPRDSIARLNL